MDVFLDQELKLMYSIGSPDVYLTTCVTPTLYCSLNDSCEMNDGLLAVYSVLA